MKKALRKLDRRFQLSRPGSVLILVVALLVLMALIGTAYLSTTRIDRYNTVQNTNNTEIDLLLEGVKNMAKATIVGSLNDPSLPFPYRPANSTIAKNWDAYDMYHQYTTDPLISTTPNDAWLSPRCPTDFVDPYPGDGIAPIIMWPCIGEPLTGNTFESPFAISTSSGTFASGVALTYTDRMSRFYVPPSPAQVGVFQADNMAGLGPDTPPGSVLTPTFATISYPDGTTKTYPAFTIAVLSSAGPTPPVAYSYKNFFESAAKTANSTQPQTYLYLAGDADGDGIADCGMVKLPVGQLNGLTYYAGIRIIDNCSAVNVNTAMSRRYDFNGAGVPTRYINSSTGTQVPTYAGIYNLGCFPANVGLAEMLQSYDGSATDNATGNLGTEFSAWMTQLLNAQYPSPGGVVTTSGQAPSASPIADGGTARSDFAYTTLGDLLWNQVARRPSNPGLVGLSTTPYVCQPANDTDEAQIAYHFVFDNPNNGRTPLELALHNSLYRAADARRSRRLPCAATPAELDFISWHLKWHDQRQRNPGLV
jgi:hypothetical protein